MKIRIFQTIRRDDGCSSSKMTMSSTGYVVARGVRYELAMFAQSG